MITVKDVHGKVHWMRRSYVERITTNAAKQTEIHCADGLVIIVENRATEVAAMLDAEEAAYGE